MASGQRRGNRILGGNRMSERATLILLWSAVGVLVYVLLHTIH